MKILYGLDVDFVNWRRFLVCVALPWPIPTAQQLVEAWTALVDNAENSSSGKMMISKEKFMATVIWLDQPTETQEEMITDEIVKVGPHYNRNHALKEVCM